MVIKLKRRVKGVEGEKTRSNFQTGKAGRP